MKIFKFMIPPGQWKQDPENPDMSYAGCVAAVIAENASDAHKLLIAFAASNGLDVGWLRAARVMEIPLVNGAVIAWAQV